MVRTDDDGIVLTDRALAGMLAPAIGALGPGVRSLRVGVDDGTVTGVDVDLAGRYGDRLLEVSDEIRDVVRTVVVRLLGEDVVPEGMSIDVSWVDVTADLSGLR
ncbi:hypothetical protein [Speluncibacter jeojiensis]|uniref:Uncharacterized protein n=1 Tax=Speluncibacter jeojiensis TaxID=2710754 RepID=A0A9X4REA1_9ACTN|nr:hypothetical protein [Corynebacteriales bacterium D3-21]